MSNIQQKLISGLVLVSSALSIQAVQAKTTSVNAAPWSSLSVGSCHIQTENTSSGDFSLVYCKGAPKMAAMGVVDHANASYSTASLAAAQCDASLNGRDIVCFGSDLASEGVQIPRVLTVPAARSCDSITWQSDEAGNLSLNGYGCKFANGERNPQLSSITLSEYTEAADNQPTPGVSNTGGGIVANGGIGDVIDY